MVTNPALSPHASVDRYLKARQAPATRRAYDACLRKLEQWAVARGEPALPLSPDHLAQFLAEGADRGLALTTLRRYAAAAGDIHRARGLPDPTASALIASLLAGIARLGRKTPTRKAALTPQDLRKMIEALPATLLGSRDRSILLLGFAGALRRSEVANLKVGDLCFATDGVEVVIRSSKADQASAGQRIFIPRGGEPCPVAALESWLGGSGIVEGFLFRRVSRADRLVSAPLQGQAIAGIVQRAARGAKLEPKGFAGHSLRSGFATAAAGKGASTWAILAITRHRSPSALRPYIRPDNMALGGAVRVL